MEMWRERERKSQRDRGEGERKREGEMVAQLRLTLMRNLCDGT